MIPANHSSNFCGHPGLVWYATVTPTLGAELRLGQWLDSLDHRGARMIFGLSMSKVDDPQRTVTFFGGDSETVRADVKYDVVDPDSQVTPDGAPVTDDWGDDDGDG